MNAGEIWKFKDNGAWMTFVEHEPQENPFDIDNPLVAFGCTERSHIYINRKVSSDKWEIYYLKGDVERLNKSINEEEVEKYLYTDEYVKALRESTGFDFLLIKDDDSSKHIVSGQEIYDNFVRVDGLSINIVKSIDE